ncbi:MAG: hemolysin family protein [Anaerovoracaceae bacterium]
MDKDESGRRSILAKIGDLLAGKPTAEEVFEEEVKTMLEAGQETGVLKEEGRKMIDSILAFDDKLAREIMTPRTDVFAIDITDPSSEYINELMELRYSRIPVYDDDSDNIIGILNIKDYLIKAWETDFDKVDIYEILRKPYFVPETKNIDSLFFDLQKSKQHIAILIDEYGGFSGIVTMEDLIEEIVGEIDDEYDEVEEEIEKVSDNVYRMDGKLYLEDINEKIGTDFESEDSETIGGFLIELLSEIPDEDNKEDWVIEHENYIFTIESVKDRRIEKIKIEILDKDKDKAIDEETA